MIKEWIRVYRKFFLYLLFLLILPSAFANKTEYKSPLFHHFSLNKSLSLKNLHQLNQKNGNLTEENPLYQRILNELNQHYESIGNRQVSNLLSQNNGVIGGLNNIGFRWGNDFSDFRIMVNRKLAPDLFDDNRWVVTDEFEITVSASRVLSNLSDRNIINITEEQFAAFAGLKFRRVYRYVHFSSSYKEGLVGNFDKLFLGFTKFRSLNLLSLESGEYIQKEDFLTAMAGGIASIPIYSNGGVLLSGTIGAFAEYRSLSKIDIEMVKKAKDEESLSYEGGHQNVLRVSSEKEKGIVAGVSSSLQVDFLNILRLTLLSFDFEYDYSDSFKTYLSIPTGYIDSSSEDESVKNELKKLLKFKKANVDILAPFIISYEKRKEERKKSKYLILLWSGQREQKTEQVEIIRDNIITRFFKHNYEKIKFKENFFSKLLSSALRGLIKGGSKINRDQYFSKKVNLEYRSDKDLIKNKGDIDLSDRGEGESKLSLQFSSELFLNKTKGFWKKRQKKKALKMLSRYSTVEDSVLDLLDQDAIHGPLKIKTRHQVGKEGLSYFNHLPVLEKYKYIDNLCDAKSKRRFFLFRSLFNFCKFKLKKSFEKYQKELIHNNYSSSNLKKCEKKFKRHHFWSFRKRRLARSYCLNKFSKRSKETIDQQVPLWRLKDFMQKMYSQSQEKNDLFRFFGMDNLFLYGSFEAKFQKNNDFLTHFSEGELKSLGVISDFQNNSSLGRLPASIILKK